MDFIDTHSHIYSEEFDPDRSKAVQRAFEAGVTKIILPDIDASSRPAMLSLADSMPNHFFPCSGLHPTSVGINYKNDLNDVEKLLSSERRFYAVGEIGIDLYWEQTFENQQFDAFKTQIEWALQLHLPIIVHVRNALEKTLAAIEHFAGSGLTGVFHCFSGSVEQAQLAVDMGFLLGIGGVVTFKKSTLPEVVEKIDIRHLLLETDCPYLAPVPHRGQRNESSYIPIIAQKIADIKQLSVNDVANQTTANARQLFGI